jgi:hypothetical protein
MVDPLWIVAHVLVLVYWLGGDLGAFYASSLLAEPGRPVAGRLTAAQVLSNVDMAPRTAMILAFPTGLALSVSRGWLALDWALVGTAFAGAAIWLALAWLVHLNARPQALLKTLDSLVRYAVLAGLVIAAGAGLAGVYALPLFLGLKFLILALAIVCGLMIRRALAPFGPAFAKLAAGKAGEAENETIRASLAHAKIYVLTIWAALIAAAALGVYTPGSWSGP